MDFSRSIPSAHTLVYYRTAHALGLDDGMVATPHRRKGANTRLRILVCKRAARRDRAVPVRPCVLARSYYRCHHLEHPDYVTARECDDSGNTGHRPVVYNTANIHSGTCEVDRHLPPAF